MAGLAASIAVRRPRQAALDAQFMKQVSQLATLNIRSTHASQHEFKPQEFATKLVSSSGVRLQTGEFLCSFPPNW